MKKGNGLHLEWTLLIHQILKLFSFVRSLSHSLCTVWLLVGILYDVFFFVCVCISLTAICIPCKGIPLEFSERIISKLLQLHGFVIKLQVEKYFTLQQPPSTCVAVL